MLTKNSDVGNGQANGSRLTLHKIVVKHGERRWPLRLESGVTVNALYASQVCHVVVKHVATDVDQNIFALETQVFPFSCKLEIEQGIEVNARMKGTQIPLISNLCTAGHKLQGCAMTTLVWTNGIIARTGPTLSFLESDVWMVFMRTYHCQRTCQNTVCRRR